MNKRLASVAAWLKAEKTDAAFITSPDNVFYLSGYRSDPHERLLGICVFQEKEPFLVCPAMEAYDAKKPAGNMTFSASRIRITRGIWLRKKYAGESVMSIR